MACIELNCNVMHPVMWKSFEKAFRKDASIILSLSPYKIEEGKIIEIEEPQENEEYLLGVGDLISNISKLEKKEGTYAKIFFSLLEKYSDRWLISLQPVLPIVARPARNEFQYDPINDLYIKLIKYSRALSDTSDTKSKKYRDIVTFVQRTVNAIYDYVQQKVAKKKGIIRQNILGKRLDFSARAVVVGDPNIKIDEVGVPFRIAVKLFEPWIIRELLTEESYDLTKATELLERCAKGYESPKQIVDIVKNVSKDRVVLMKRDPSLHRLSWQAFNVVIVLDEAIHVNPLVVSGFNMDFDGDQAALFHPMSKEAQEEARKLQNPYHPANPRKLKYTFTKDMKTGIYMLTSDPIKEIKKKLDFWKQEEVDGVKTTKGRRLLFEAIPKQLRIRFPFEEINKPIKDADSITLKLLEMSQESEIDLIKEYLNKAVKLAVYALQEFNASFGIDIIAITDKIQPLLKQFKNASTLDEKQKIQKQIEKVIREEALKTDMKPLIESGILRFHQLVQMIGVKGIVIDPTTKQPIAVDDNFAKGLKPTNYFLASYGARSGIISRTDKTSITGYMQRKLNYALASVELDPDQHDCGTKRFLEIKCTEDIFKRIINRYVLKDGRLKKVTKADTDLIGSFIKLRSSIFCRSPKLCTTCYGEDYKLLDTTKVGFLAAESLAERLTQNMLKAFHVGGTVEIKKIPFVEDVIENTKLSKEELSQLFRVKDDIIYSTQNIDLYFDTDKYNLRLMLSGENDYYDLSIIVFDVRAGDKLIKLAYDGTLRIFAAPNMDTEYRIDSGERKRYYKLSYPKDYKVAEVLPETSDLEEQIKKFKAAFEGRIEGRDIHHTLWRLYKRTASFGVINLVHLEILVSQLVRCKHNLSIPARLCPTWEPVMVSITKIPQYESWIRSLQFERFHDSVENALVKGKLQSSSLLDRIMV